MFASVDWDPIVKIVAVTAGLAGSAGGGAALVQYLLGKRKADVDDKGIIVSGAVQIVGASEDIVKQVREQMAILFEQNRQCAEDNKILKAQNAELVGRVVELERFKARVERERLWTQ